MTISNLDILEKGQLSVTQAKAILHVMESDFSSRQAELATKGDLVAVRSDLKSEVTTLKGDIVSVAQQAKFDLELAVARLEAKIDAGKTETIRWVLGSSGLTLAGFYFLLNYAHK